MRPRCAFLCLASIVALGGAVRADEPVVPVAPELVHGRTLQLDEYNCSVDAPADNWEWLTQKQAVPNTYMALCRDRSGRAKLPLIFSIEAWDHPTLDAKHELELLLQILKPLEVNERRVEDAAHESAQIPLPFRSMHYAAKLKTAQGELGLEGYVGTKQKMYSMSRLTSVATAQDRADDPNLRAMAQSFRLLAEVSDIDQPGTPSPVRVTIFVVVVLGLLAGVIFLFVRRAHDKKERAARGKK